MVLWPFISVKVSKRYEFRVKDVVTAIYYPLDSQKPKFSFELKRCH